ncbi:hypothetical protein ACVIW0_005455 [Bradyrhizobium sp. USDA 4454]
MRKHNPGGDPLFPQTPASVESNPHPALPLSGAGSLTAVLTANRTTMETSRCPARSISH